MHAVMHLGEYSSFKMAAGIILSQKLHAIDFDTREALGCQEDERVE